MSGLALSKIAELYGMHRSSVYAAASEGRVTTTIGRNGQRVMDISEAIRVWGEPETIDDGFGGRYSIKHATDAEKILSEIRLIREDLKALKSAIEKIGLSEKPQH